MVWARKDFCDNGHALTPENVYISWPRGRETRICRICKLAESRRRHLESYEPHPKKRTHCKYGHLWVAGARRCAECTRLRNEKWLKTDQGLRTVVRHNYQLPKDCPAGLVDVVITLTKLKRTLREYK